jgi:uncharacterized protein YdiU (UPF0061 family)
VAPSFVRFGNFEIFAARKDRERLTALADYTIRTHFPALGRPSPDTYVAWFDEVCRRTIATVVHWMRVGFVHGVLNTDNMSVLGLTIDYGPYGWLEDYDPDWTPNTTDASGRRYRYGHQPQIALWNLSRFGSALVPLIGSVEALQGVLERAARDMDAALRRMLHEKLGLAVVTDEEPLVGELLALLQRCETDMTIFFRRLADVDPDAGASDERLLAPLRDAYYAPEGPDAAHRAATLAWLRRYTERLRHDGEPTRARQARMNATNPRYVLRNYLAQLAIDDAERGDPGLVRTLLDVLRRPYAEQPEHDQFAAKRPEWARHRPGCSMLSCSS